MRKLLGLLVSFLFVVAVQAQPNNTGECTASFTAIVDAFTVTLEGSATIEDSTDVVVDWFWSLGQGFVFTGQTVTASLPPLASGVYNVCLSITTANGCYAVTCQDIVINDDGSGGIDSTACYIWAGFFATTNGTTTSFTDFSETNGGSGITWSWDFGDGNTSTEQNPIHTFADEGTYEVCLTITDANGCTDTNCQFIATAGAPIECFTILSGLVPYEEDDSIMLIVMEQDPYCCNNDWDNVCQNLYDEIANGGGGTDSLDCSAMFYHTANDSIGGQNPIGLPSGLTVTFWDGSWGAGEWIWDMGDGTTLEGPQIMHTYDAPGTYTVCLTISNDAGCTDTYCEDIVVIEAEDYCFAQIWFQPTTDVPLTFTFFAETWSNDDAATWEWDFGDDATSNEENPTHTYMDYGDYTVCLTLTTASGCTFTQCIQANLANPADCEAHFWASAFPADSIGIDSSGIFNPWGGLTVSFWDCSIGNPTNWTWDFGDGNTGTGPFVEHTYDAAGTYTVCLTITNEAGCDDTTCQDIVVTEGQDDFCYAEFSYYPIGGTASGANGIQFENWSSDNAEGYQWDFGDGNVSEEENPIHAYADEGLYTVCLTIVTADGCLHTSCQTVLVGDDWNPQGFSLCGSVNVNNDFDEPTAYDATVYLIEYDPEAGTLTEVASTFAIGFGWGQSDSSSFSFYCFDGLEEGTYMVKAAMNEGSPLYEDYLPTYYDGVLSWMDATPVTVDDDIFGIDINMVAGDNPGGPGFIGGSIADGAGKSLTELGGIMVILIDADGNPVGFTHTDEEGNYSFENVEYGSYTVHVEILNIPSEQNTVTIHEENPDAGDVNFTLHSDQVTADFSTSIEDLIAIGINNFTLAPNPVQNQAVLKFNAESSMQATMRVFNLMGQNVATSDLNISTGDNTFEVDASQWAEGIYLIDLSQNGKSLHQIKVVKQ